MPFALTSASNLLIVSSGPYLLCIVINPSAAIACAPDRNITAVKAKTLPLVRRPASGVTTIHLERWWRSGSRGRHRAQSPESLPRPAAATAGAVIRDVG